MIGRIADKDRKAGRFWPSNPTVGCDGVDPLLEQIAEKLKAEGIRVLSVRESRFSMEDVFISIVTQAQQRGAAVS